MTPADATFARDLQAGLRRMRGAAAQMCRGRPADADDLLQTTALKAWRRRDTYTPGTEFCPWLYRILRNTWISNVRLRANRAEHCDADTADMMGWLATAAPQEAAVLMREVADALDSLPAFQRDTLLASVLDGATHEELAARTGVAEGTAKTRIFRARQALARHIEGARA